MAPRGALLRSHVASALLVCALAACGSTRTRFDAYGRVGGGATSGPRAPSVDAVEVYYGTAPDGFSLRDNELTVEPGYDHRILGVAQVIAEGPCTSSEIDKVKVLEQLQRSAYDHGGTAVIYAHSNVSDTPVPSQRCEEIKGKDNVGSGWVVVLAPG
jgi:hypothetical protein